MVCSKCEDSDIMDRRHLSSRYCRVSSKHLNRRWISTCIVGTMVFVMFFGRFSLPECLFPPTNEPMPSWTSPLKNMDLVQLVLPELDTAVTVPLHIRQNTEKSHWAIIFIMSLPQSYKNRHEIRQTWYSWKNVLDIEVLFFIGISSDNPVDIPPMLYEELDTYDDIILESHSENYFTLPIKVLRAMKYFLKTFLPKRNDNNLMLPFFIKTDEDVFINLPNLSSHLTQLKARMRQNYVGGNLYTLATPNRDPLSKFYIPYSIYSPCFWPNYVAGPLYIVSGMAVRCIYEASLDVNNQALLPFEDVFLTGVIANRKCGIDLFQVQGMYDVTWRVRAVLNDPDQSRFNEGISFTPMTEEYTMVSLFKRTAMNYNVQNYSNKL